MYNVLYIYIYGIWCGNLRYGLTHENMESKNFFFTWADDIQGELVYSLLYSKKSLQPSIYQTNI